MDPSEASTLPFPQSSEPAAPTQGLVHWTVERPTGEAMGVRIDEGFPEGTLIGRKYVVGQLLGRGGTAYVFRAHGHTIGRPVALKIQSHAASEDIGLRARFLRESRLLASIDHPSVVRVYEVGLLPDGSLACALELLEGLTLRETLAREGALAPARAIEIAVQLVSALAAIHERGVVHRDLKPGNIMLVPGRRGLRVKLIDFGAAKQVAHPDRSITAPADVVGTPGYLAPEQLTPGAMVDGRTDLFALGVVLFEMLVGHKPFGSSSASLVQGLSEGRAPMMEMLAKVASPSLTSLITELCANDPGARPLGALEVATRLAGVPEAKVAEVDAAPRSSRPPGAHLQVLVVSASPVRRDAWSRAVSNLGGLSIPLAHVEAALLLLDNAVPTSPSTVLLDMTTVRAEEEVHVRALLALDARRLARVIHVVREPKVFWSGSDPRVRPLPMPVTEADLAVLLPEAHMA